MVVMANTGARTSKLGRWFPYLLIVLGVLGIIFSLILTYDQIQVWKSPAYNPSCSLNPILSCGSVINSEEGHIFGIPGPFFGLLAFPVMVTVGVAQLAGAKFKRWFWLGMQFGVLGGAAYALWLFWLSVYQIKALCPFCLATDVVVYTALWYVTLYNIEQKVIAVPKSLAGVAAFARRHHLDILVLWLLIVTAFILQHFWYYFGKHLPF